MRNRFFPRIFLFLVLGAALFLFPIFSWGAQSSDVQISISAIVGSPTPPTPTPPPLPPGPGEIFILPQGEIIFQGRAYPSAFITILKDGQVVSTLLAESSGLFKKQLTLQGGTYNFGIYAEDTEGRKSVTLNFTTSVLKENLTTVSGIFIPPTIAVAPNSVEQGRKINISGQVFPESKIEAFISPGKIEKRTDAGNDGKWSIEFNTASLNPGEYEVSARGIFGDGEQSRFSQSIGFSVLSRLPKQCQGPDLNFDGKVDIVDFSILLYFWKQTNPSNVCADINANGAVDIFDFSIMMWGWTG